MRSRSSLAGAAVIPRILVVNPNTSETFTSKIAIVSRESGVRTGALVKCMQPNEGPKSIESVTEELTSAIPTLAIMREYEDLFDAMVVACFSDHPVVHAARECLKIPVVGLMDASILTALFLGDKVSIVSTAPSWAPLLRKGCESMLGCGQSSRIASIRTIDLPVLALEGGRLATEGHETGGAKSSPHEEEAGDEATRRICAEAVLAVEEDGADVIVLGCAGMAELRGRVEGALGTRSAVVVEPVAAAVEIASSLARQKLLTAKGALYGFPKSRGL